MNDTLPDHYDDLDASIDRAWSLIEQSALDRDAPGHTPTIATVAADGTPSQRIMVLRECDRPNHRLYFHTDSRADKVAQIGTGARYSVLFYDPGAKLQLRIGGSARIEMHGGHAENAWQSAGNYARRCYLAEPGPGTPVDAPTSGLPHALEGEQPSDKQLEPARSNFAVLVADVDIIDFLYLARQGHRRARFALRSDRWQGQWLVP